MLNVCKLRFNKEKLDFLYCRNSHVIYFIQQHLSKYKTLTSTTNTWPLHCYTVIEHQKLDKSNSVSYFKTFLETKKPEIVIITMDI